MDYVLCCALRLVDAAKNGGGATEHDSEAEQDVAADDDVEAGKWRRRAIVPSVDSAIGTASDSQESEDGVVSKDVQDVASLGSSEPTAEEEEEEECVDRKIMRKSAPEYPFAREGDHEYSIRKANERRCLEEHIRQKYEDDQVGGSNVVVVQEENGSAVLAAARQSEKETTIVVDAPPSRAVDVVIRGCASGRCVHVTDPVDSESIDRKLFQQMALRLENIERELRDHAARSDITSIASVDEEKPNAPVLEKEDDHGAEQSNISVEEAVGDRQMPADDHDEEDPVGKETPPKISLPMITPGFLGDLINLDSVDEDEEEYVTSKFGVLPDFWSSTPQGHEGDPAFGESGHCCDVDPHVAPHGVTGDLAKGGARTLLPRIRSSAGKYLESLGQLLKLSHIHI